ncbi:FAD-dependent monooxygenase [Pseudofrancisella aestuarii]|uniref:FAD-dependent monooxygenase n=1 Tax=Pseudofrancisella aestuarii TaxID=2670347 RepID=A0ABV9T9V7_9GAMM|nr:FAD-dependent monooxygenase [Pseudofrancisella aestuarii]
MKDKYNIVIVGGGVVGLLTSLSLAKQGFQILHIEKDALVVKNDNRSLALSYSSTAILNALNLWSEIEGDSQPIKKVHVSDKGNYGRAELSAEEENLPFLGYIVKMRLLLEVALKRVSETKNITKAFLTTVESISDEQNEYVLNIRDSENNQKKIKADLFIACDGANSSIRKQLGVLADNEDYKQDAIVFDIDIELDHQGVAYERFIGDGVLALLPKDDNKMACVWTVDRDKVDPIVKLSDNELKRFVQEKFGYRLGEFLNISKPIVFPLYLVQSQKVFKENVLFFGNALHFLHPVSGQGLNLSIRDIGCLYDLFKDLDITDKQKLTNVLQNFADVRKSDHKRTVKVTHSFIQLFVSDNFALKTLRNTGLHLLQRSKTAKKTFSKLMMGKFSKGSTLMRKVVE